MKILFIGGTGNISTAASRLALERGMDLYHYFGYTVLFRLFKSSITQ